MNTNELIYTIKNQPYFKVYVISHGRIIKQFVQLAGSSNDSAESFFLISKDLKSTWFKPFTPIIDGLKFITYVDLANAIPLKFTKETKFVSTDFITREVEVITISEDEEKQKQNKKDGLPEKLIEIPLPPTLLYQTVEANFVTKILTAPPEKWDFLNKKWLFIAALGLVAIWFINGGKLF